MTLKPGDNLGRYRLEDLLGRGGMADVYRATDTRLGRRVAVKVIQAGFAADSQFRSRFLQEARLVAALEHPNILPVYDFGEEGGLPYLVMPCVEGGTLGARLRSPGIDPATARVWLGQIASALDAAHAAGVLHRDIKPNNVLLSQDDRAVLADFGIARSLESSVRLTATGTALGTPAYMAPEIAKGETASRASDLYALGAMAFEMLSGTPPFVGENPLAVLHQHIAQPAPLLSNRAPHLGTALDEVFQQALAKDPDPRPASGAELVALLDASLTGEVSATAATVLGSPAAAAPPVQAGPTEPRPEGVQETYATRPPRRRGLQAAVALLAVVLGTVLVLRWLPVREPDPATALDPGEEIEGPSGLEPAVDPQAPTSFAPDAEAEPSAPIPDGPTVSAEDSPKIDPTPSTQDRRPPPPSGELALEAERRSFAPTGRDPKAAGPLAGGGSEDPRGARAPVSGQGDPMRGMQPVERMARRFMDRLRQPRPFTEVDFRLLRDQARTLLRRRADDPLAQAMLPFALGGLAYAAGDLAEASSRLEELLSVERLPPHLWVIAPLWIARNAAETGSFAEWQLAASFGDPKSTGFETVEQRLAAAPGDSLALFARAQLHHLHGRRPQAIQDASAWLSDPRRAERRDADAVALFLAQEYALAGQWAEALSGFQTVAKRGGAAAEIAGLQAGQIAGEQLGDPELARRIYRAACEGGHPMACRRLRELDSGGGGPPPRRRPRPGGSAPP